MADSRIDLSFPGHYKQSEIHAANTYNAESIIQYFGHNDSKDVPTLEEIDRWLDGPNQHAIQSDHLDQRHRGTGAWFINSDKFQRFVHRPDGARLRCYGIRGSGKTILMSTAIEYLQAKLSIPYDLDEERSVLLFLYLKSTDTELQNKHFVASLLKQVLLRKQELSSTVRELYLLHRSRGTYPREEELVAVLSNELTEASLLYVVVDALDEISEQTRAALLRTLFHLPRSHPLRFHLLVTSYDTQIIGVGFNKDEDECMEIVAHESDLRSYIGKQLQAPSINELLRDHAEVSKSITQILVEKAKGMFLLVDMHLKLLVASRSRTRKSLEAFAQNLSPTLNEVYKELWAKVLLQDVSDLRLAWYVCLWLSFSTRNLHVDVIRHALFFSDSTGTTTEITEDGLVLEIFLIDACKGLVRIESSTRIILFSHYTAAEFFPTYLSKLTDLRPHREIANACLKQLRQTFITPDENNEISTIFLDDLLTRLPLLSYAVHHVAHHIQRAAQMELHQPIRNLFDHPQQASIIAHTCAWACDQSHLSQASHFRVSQITILHLVSFWGLEDLLSSLIQEGPHVDTIDELGWTPLRWALWADNNSMIKFLVRNGADIAHISSDGKNVLEWALGHPHRSDRWLGSKSIRDTGRLDVGPAIFLSPVSSALWIRGPPLNTSEESLNTLIDVASDEFLYTCGSDVMLVAARKRIGSVVTKMLQRGLPRQGLVEALIGPSYNETTPSLTVRDDAKANVGWRIFVDARQWQDDHARVHLAPDDYRWICALVTPENANQRNGRGQTVLSLAAEMGMPEVVQSLIDNGADVNARDDDGRTPLFSAVMRTRTQRIRVQSCTASGRARVHIGARVYIYGNFDSQSPSGMAMRTEASAKVEAILLDNGAYRDAEFCGTTYKDLASGEPGAIWSSFNDRHSSHSADRKSSHPTSLSHPGIVIGSCTRHDKAVLHTGGIYREYTLPSGKIRQLHSGYQTEIASGVLRALLSLISIEVGSLTVRDEAKASISVAFWMLPTVDEIRNLESTLEGLELFGDELDVTFEESAEKDDSSNDEFHDACENTESG